MIKQILLLEKRNGEKINKKGWIWLLAAVPAALAALVWGVNELSKPKPTAGSLESIISSIPVWGWVVGALFLLVLIKSR